MNVTMPIGGHHGYYELIVLFYWVNEQFRLVMLAWFFCHTNHHSYYKRLPLGLRTGS